MISDLNGNTKKRIFRKKRKGIKKRKMIKNSSYSRMFNLKK